MRQGSFDSWQQTFTLSMMANGEMGALGTAKEPAANLSSVIQSRLGNSGLQNLIGSSWEIAWGPCVFQRLLSVTADNAMYVAHDTINKIYVVAIAATNRDSLYDIFKEDLKVKPIPWPYGSGGDAFAKEVLYQHIYAYFELLNVAALLTLTDSSGKPLFNPPNPFASTGTQSVLASV
jgi:hypothetical protein